MSDNPFTKMIDQTGERPYKLIETTLKGVVSKPTFYSLIRDHRGIPPKTHWQTIEAVARALGYKIVFEPEQAEQE